MTGVFHALDTPELFFLVELKNADRRADRADGVLVSFNGDFRNSYGNRFKFCRMSAADGGHSGLRVAHAGAVSRSERLVFISIAGKSARAMQRNRPVLLRSD